MHVRLEFHETEYGLVVVLFSTYLARVTYFYARFQLTVHVVGSGVNYILVRIINNPFTADKSGQEVTESYVLVSRVFKELRKNIPIDLFIAMQADSSYANQLEQMRTV